MTGNTFFFWQGLVKADDILVAVKTCQKYHKDRGNYFNSKFVNIYQIFLRIKVKTWNALMQMFSRIYFSHLLGANTECPLLEIKYLILC